MIHGAAYLIVWPTRRTSSTDFIKGNATLRLLRDMGRFNRRVILLGPITVRGQCTSQPVWWRTRCAAPTFFMLSTNLFNVRFYSMLEHFCECYSDLSGLILCPVLGSITPLFIPNSRIRPIRLIGLCASLITFLYPPVPRIQFDPSTAKSQFVESLRWLPYENIHFYLGIDGISLFFVILTTFLIPICILVGWSGMRSYGKEYITASLIREFLMIAVFCMLDPLLFYVLPESVLIPMLCGAEHLLFAGIKLFLCRGLVQ
ncbi:hypothetical protein SO802_035172 [Lithocarpus litseifolius]